MKTKTLTLHGGPEEMTLKIDTFNDGGDPEITIIDNASGRHEGCQVSYEEAKAIVAFLRDCFEF